MSVSRFISIERVCAAANNTWQSISEWIANQGGWQAAVDSMADISNTLGESAVFIATFCAATACLVGVALWLRSRR